MRSPRSHIGSTALALATLALVAYGDAAMNAHTRFLDTKHDIT
jgi:hypothetical protein